MRVKLIYNFGTGWMTGVSGFDSLRGQRFFSVSYLDWSPVKIILLYSGYRGSFLAFKQPWHEADHPLPFSVKLMNKRNCYILIVPYVAFR